MFKRLIFSKCLSNVFVSLLSFLLLTQLFGCSKGLSRQDAADAIQAKLNSDVVITNVKLVRSAETQPEKRNLMNNSELLKSRKDIQALIDQKLVTATITKSETYREIDFRTGKPYWLHLDVIELNLTSNANPFIVNDDKQKKVVTVQALQKELVEITAISKPADFMGKKICRVRYSYKLATTPFGDAMIPYAESSYTDNLWLYKDSMNKIETGEATFALYDNGWQIE